MHPPLYVLFEVDEREEVESRLLPLLADHAPVLIALDEGGEAPDIPADSRIACWLSDGALKTVLSHALNQRWQLGLLPHPGLVQARLGFGVANRLEHALEDFIGQLNPVAVDVLYCNDEPVFNSVVIGDTYSLKPARVAGDNLWMRLKRLLGLIPNLMHLTLHPFRVSTQKDKSIDTAALGIVAVEHGRSSPLSRRILDDSSASDGMLHALILAPRSVFELLGFLITSVFLPARSSNRLPPFVGHVKSACITITSTKPVPYTLDGINHREERLVLRAESEALQLLPGRHLSFAQDHHKSDKEVFKVQALPIGEARTALISYAMPWIHHAATEEFRDLFLMLRENAKTSEIYLTLMVLSTLLATVGLFANSAPVIIGAMILAPLMAPIISMAMGLLRQDERLIGDSGRALAIGIGLAIFCAMLLAMITPLEYINSEIGARLKPTLLDLAVAVISGIAGAYAHARAEIAKSLAGVAIAVALVPPLAVTGIGLGWLNWTVFSGALLLFLTNLAGIVLAAALTFLWLGYSPFKRATRGLLISLTLVILVSIPLGLGFYQMVNEYRIINALDDWQVADIRLQEVRVRKGSPLYIQAKLISAQPLDGEQLATVKAAMESHLERDIILESVVAIVQ